MAVSARLYAGSAAIDPSAGSASAAMRRSSSWSGRIRPVPLDVTCPRSALLGGEPDAEADQDASGQRVQATPDPRPVEQRPGPGHDQAVHGQPSECEQAEQEPEAEEGDEAGASGARELGQQADEEASHLRIAQVAEEALPQGADRTQRQPRTSGGCGLMTAPRSGGPQRLDAKKDQVGGADCLQGQESGSRGTKQAR